jgi:hypothetical protein
MELLMQFSPASCHFVPLRSEYSPQNPVLRHPQRMVLPLMQQAQLHTHKNNR